MSEKIIVYMVTSDPELHVLDDAEEVYQIKVICSVDGGSTCGPLWFTFDTKEQALEFSHDINIAKEPVLMGSEVDEDE